MAARAAQCGALCPKIDEELDDVTVDAPDSVTADANGDPAQRR